VVPVADHAQRLAPSWWLCSPAVSQFLTTRLSEKVLFWSCALLALPLALQLEFRLPAHSLVHDSGWLDGDCCEPHGVTALERCASTSSLNRLKCGTLSERSQTQGGSGLRLRSAPPGHRHHRDQSARQQVSLMHQSSCSATGLSNSSLISSCDRLNHNATRRA